MAQITDNSRRVAKNTLLLYLRMLLMMFIGLFTSRVILKALGEEDFGTYTVIYEMVMLFTIVSGSVSNAISRYMAYEIGRGDLERQQRVFSSAMIIQTAMAVLLTGLTLTAGLWYLRHGLVIPQGREEAALWVLVCTAGLMMVQLYSIPFNATIIACEDMKAFAYISILEAVLKLAVAVMVMYSPADTLAAYAVLMLAVGLIIRSTYAIYCRRHCPQTQGRLCYDRHMVRAMLSFSGWSFLGNGVNVLSTKGVSLLSNAFFGVGINAARGIALQVENLVKQFVTNFLTALNPQITKSWASGDRDYCYELVGKGSKFSLLIMFMLSIPICFETDALLEFWLGSVPQWTAWFVRLTLACLVMDMSMNSVFQMVLASGRVAAYYTATSIVIAAAFLLSWAAFTMGFEAWTSYAILLVALKITASMKLWFAHRLCSLPIWSFMKENIFGVTLAAVISCAFCSIVLACHPGTWLRISLNCIAAPAIFCIAAWKTALTEGEKEFIKEHISKISGTWKRRSL